MESHEIEMRDYGPSDDAFRRDVLAGLRRRRRTLPCKYLYDERGSQLFDRICELEEYYPTRTELAIMRENAGDIAHTVGAGSLLIEYGSGSSWKTRILLDQLEEPAGYVPIDISREHLARTAEELAASYPSLEVLPVCADYTRRFELPTPQRPVGRRVVYFPGSTLGNFHPGPARRFLAGIAELAGSGGGLLLGLDRKKDPAVLERAYDDAEGVTAAFNLNLLRHINRELGADFDLDAWKHHAVYNPTRGRVEMHLISLREQVVHVGDESFRFAPFESIRTECSYKFNIDDLATLAPEFEVARTWNDPDERFTVVWLVVR